MFAHRAYTQDSVVVSFVIRVSRTSVLSKVSSASSSCTSNVCQAKEASFVNNRNLLRNSCTKWHILATCMQSQLHGPELRCLTGPYTSSERASFTPLSRDQMIISTNRQ